MPVTTARITVNSLMIATLAFSVGFALFGCGGPALQGSPQAYGEHGSNVPARHVVADSSAPPAAVSRADTLNTNEQSDTVRSAIEPESADSADADTLSADSSNALGAHLHTLRSDHSSTSTYAVGIDNADSAAAVDDEIWRAFDLAEEYHAMGVIANREASWEEAQYYFEKCLKILASLDIVTDSVLTPEAVKYNAILDNVVSDYRTALRSLGQLQENTEPSVLLERFGDIASRLGHDTLVVTGVEQPSVTFDLPIVMNDRVRSSIIYFQTVARDAFRRYLSRKNKYERMFKETLSKHDLPHDLVYLSLVESGFNPNAYSWARAMGLWQFISSTGRLYGLKRNWWLDERKDPVKSTNAAARFLKDLYQRFGNWELAMAGYNGGPGRVARAIKKQKTIDFWKLKLRRQTMDYVPLIYAAAIIAKDPERYGFTDIEYEPEMSWDEVEIDRCLDLKVVARELGCSVKQLKELNPELLRNYTPPNVKKYRLKVPVGTRKRFFAAYDRMPSPKETSWVKHRIRRGETVSTIAAKYGVSQYAIFEANNLRRRARIYAGKTLIVPVPLDRDYRRHHKKKRKYVARGATYSVRSGDTLWDIARAFGTSVSAIRRINYIERGSRIYVGQNLRIPSNARKLKKKSASTKLYASGSSATGHIGKSSPKTVRRSAGKGTKAYKVRVGDTLWDIARMFGTTTGRIRKLNGLGRSSRIYPGQKLLVQTGAADYIIHKVRRGETLSRIAHKYRTSIARIMAQNDLIDPDAIAIGDKLKIYVK